MNLPDVRSRIRPYLNRLKLSPKQRLLSKFFCVGLLMAIGAAGVIAGLPLLGLMVASGMIVGVVLSAVSVAFGASLVVAGYIWFTL
jgi:hypothetical protein